MWPQKSSSDPCLPLTGHRDSKRTQSRSGGNHVFENSASQTQYHPATQTREYVDGALSI